MINDYQETFRNYNQNLANKHIQIAENYLQNCSEMKNKNSTILKQYTQEAIDEANMAIKTSLPYIENELVH